jgi:L-alanine-DL-glutamate epimerase-like enolase superfamily enzyme
VSPTWSVALGRPHLATPLNGWPAIRAARIAAAVKITDVRIVLHASPARGRLPFGARTDGKVPLGVLVIETDEGLQGTDFVGGPGPGPAIIGQQIVNFLKPLLVGRDPLDIGALWQAMHQRQRYVDPGAIGVVDVALWDIAGKAAGLPIHRLLGSYRQKVPAYFSSGHHPDAAGYAAEASYWRDQGWRGYKLHPPSLQLWGGGVPVEADIEACTAVREAVNTDLTLMLDSGWSYSYPAAVRVGRAIEELGYYWYEDPLSADDIHGYVRLKQQLHIPLLATEITVGGLHALPPWLMASATDFLRGDVVIKGGITGLLKIAHLAEAFRMNCEVHDGYNALNNVACLHVIMAIPNCEWFEVLTFNTTGEFGLERLSYGLTEPLRIDTDGYVHAPTRPGLGYDVDWDVINAARIGEIS